MKTDNGEDAGRPGTIGPVKIEWNWDFDNRWHEMTSIGLGDKKYTFREEGWLRLKGRCRRCWGGLIGKRATEDVPTAIRRRVCGILLEGDEARAEYRRMSKLDASNTIQMALGLRPKYRDDSRFVSKIFPHIDHQSAEELHKRTSAAVEKVPRKGWLTRREFPEGSAGFLFLQARALMSGVERLPRELSVARFWDFDMHDDGSATVYVPTKELSEDPKARENELMKRLGSTMTWSHRAGRIRLSVLSGLGTSQPVGVEWFSSAGQFLFESLPSKIGELPLRGLERLGPATLGLDLVH